jgi:dTDP-4-dehydrorhamnose 3,5-epimerase-like enzyme
MKTRHCPINHFDGRGLIRDIFPTAAPDAVTLITQRAGSVRGNHVHLESTQHLFVVSGGIIAYTKRYEPDRASREPERVERVGLGAGALITHAPGEAHAYQALVDSVLLAFACGIRKGMDYEADTIRLDQSLIEQYLETYPNIPVATWIGEPW